MAGIDRLNVVEQYADRMIGNRLVQSMGWPGMVRVTERWFPWSRYASAMAIVTALNVEEGGAFEVSSAEAILDAL